jgi:hypothetical protein
VQKKHKETNLQEIEDLELLVLHRWKAYKNETHVMQALPNIH